LATPIGHAIAGYAVSSFAKAPQASQRLDLIIACTFAALAPDLDVIPGLIMGSPAQFHAGITHSLSFAALVSLGIAGILRWRGPSFAFVFVLSFISYSTHLVMDMLGPDGRPPFGIPLFWPVSNIYVISPVPLLLGVKHAATANTPTSEWIQAIFSLYNLAAIAVEVLVTVPFILVAYLLRRRRSKARQNHR
jgi:inner membrane protein